MATTQGKRRPPKIHMRWMIRRDLPATVGVESAAGGLWTAEDFIDALLNRNCVGMVAEVRGEIVGYAVYDLHEDHLDVRKLVVHPDHRGQGVGSALLEKLFYKLTSHRRPTVKFRQPDGGVWVPAVEPSWRSETVRLMTAADTPPDLGVLADALQEAGCEDDVLLGVLRRGGRVGAVVYGALREWLATGVSPWPKRDAWEG